MIQVSLLFPNRPGAEFDLSYYVEIHMPMLRRLLGERCRRVAAQRALPACVGPSAFVAVGQLEFDSIDDFERAFADNAPRIAGDRSNFTNIEPIVQIGEIVY